MRLVLWLLSVVLFSQVAAAEPTVNVKEWHAFGGRGCNKDEIFLISNGNALSFLFNSFQTELRADERSDGLFKTRFCVLTILLEVPQNKCISSMEQTVSGGVLKSARTYGSVQFFSWLNGGSPVAKTLSWKLGNEITPDEEESLFTLTARNQPRCLRSRWQRYVAYVYLNGVRTRFSESFLSAIDSIDGEVTLKLRLQ